jgi:hypothetical protein
MDIEIQLRKLESRYRVALNGAVAAKAHYLALRSEPSVALRDVEHAENQWKTFESRKRALAARMGEIEELDPDVTA